MAFIPGFGEQSVPVRVRLLLTLAFTAIVGPAVSANVLAMQGAGSVFLLATETIAGLALGLILRLSVVVLQLAGAIAGQATSLSQIFGSGATPDPSPAIGNILVISGLALAFVSGLHIKISLALIYSYDVMPVGRFPDSADIAEWGISNVAKAFEFAFSLSAPFVIASVIYNVALGAINRAMPQLMVAFVGAPAITAAGLILLLLTAPALLSQWQGRFDQLLSNPFGALP